MKPPSAKASLGTLFLVVLVNLIGFGLIIPLLPLYARDMHVSSVVLGLLFASYSLGQVVAAPLLGRLSDRMGRRPILLLSVGGTAVSFVMLGVGYEVGSLTMLFASRILDGITGGNISVAQAYAADITTTKNRSRAMGLLGAAFGLGFVLGPAVGAGLSLKFWHAIVGPLAAGLPAYGAAMLAAVSFVLAWRLLPETVAASAGTETGADSAAVVGPSGLAVDQPGFCPDDESGVARRSERSPPAAVGPDLFHLRRLGRALAEPNLGSLLGLYFLIMLAWAGMEVYFVWLIHDRVFPALSAGDHQVMVATFLFFVFVGLVMVAVQGGLVGRLARRFDEPMLIAVGSAVVAMGFFVLAEGQGWAALGVGSLLLAVGNSLFGPSATGLISVFTSASEQGQNLGLGQSVGAAARIAGPILFGWLYGVSRSGDHVAGRLPFLSGGVMIALATVAAFALLAHFRRELARRHARADAAAFMSAKF